MKAVIFDMNGVIINDEHIHLEAWTIFGKRHNFLITKDEYKQNMLGRIEADTLKYLFKKQLSKEELEKYVAERVKIAKELFEPQLVAIEGVVELIKTLHKNKIPIGLATSARSSYTSFILDGLDIRKYFKVVVTAEEVSYGKPDPEIYLKAAESLAVDPKDCLVFEDTITGIKAGQAAGMKVIAISSTHPASELSLADKVISTFKGLKIEDLSLIK